jgi:hypothetical protein
MMRKGRNELGKFGVQPHRSSCGSGNTQGRGRKRSAEDETMAVPRPVPGLHALALLQTMLLLSVELGRPAMRG